MKNKEEPKVLFLDIETSLMKVLTFGIFDQTIPHEDIDEDWYIHCWAASWLGSDEILFDGFRDEKKMLKRMWSLLCEADVIVTQYGKNFDVPRLMARMIILGIEPFSPFEHVDTKRMAKKFGFTSYSLAYLCKVLKTKHQKLEHSKFPGKKLWKEVAKGNLEAKKEMEIYNKQDILCLKDVYEKLRVWGDPVSFNPHREDASYVCNCGSRDFKKRGFCTTKSGKFQQYQCLKCGSWHQDKGAKNDLFSKEKKESMKGPKRSL